MLARLLGADQFGVYAFALAWVTVLSVFAKVGLDTTLVRFVATYTQRKDWSALRGILSTADRWAALGSGVVVISFILTLYSLEHRLPPETSRTLRAGALLLPVLAFLAVRGAALRALRRIVRGLLPDLLIRHLLFASVLGILYWIGWSVTRAHEAMALHAAAGAMALLVAAIWLRQALPAPLRGAEATRHSREWFRVALSLLLVTSMNLLIGQTSIILVGMLDTARGAGVYAVAQRIAVLTTFALTATNTTLAPLIAELYSNSRRSELQATVRHAARLTFLFTLPIAITLIGSGPFLLRLFGAEFGTGFAALAILVGGQTVNALVGPAGFLLIMTKHHAVAAAVLVSSAVFGVVANVVLIPRFGITGAAAATAATLLIWNATMFWFTWRLLGINPSITGGMRRTQRPA